MWPFRAWVALCAFATLAVAQPTPSPLDGAALGDALRRGGYVIYFRHTSTDFSQNDAAMTSFEDCARQRNLTDTGRAEAREIGAAIKRARIPIGEVLASPYCRTMETGRLIFGRATSAMAARGGPSSAEGDRYLDLRKLFSRGAPEGTNLAIASHGNPFHAVAGPPYLAEGEAAIIAPGGANGFTVVARVKKTEWDSLAMR
ncbi:MAG TPA: histidine phosphatase family protein [Casimicrobiaceae bacterium]|nr:histidine phosphatase family protein [Casimicrobiaceae bacterium]